MKNASTLTAKEVKSYATSANLFTALEKMNIHNHRLMVCQTVEGRFTAIFIGAQCINGIWALGDGGKADGTGPVLGTGFKIVG